ncbi:XRE family transcriptional regulator [Acutalibacter sp. 1XD8-33]|uniref:helix-turn-helix domain-containing protein n=1 Tax=Acutalibacter sp. 1XD8-33 TaxID=2320081 RepID=UPI000EA049A6|nr:XRE family transcriptional regulator [Acutalibacter sp. 1XD8-33]
MYPAPHRSPEEKFIDAVNKRIQNQSAPTNLQTLRKIAGYSQRVLSEKSGVNLRTLQQYELRAKDITKASGRSLSALSKTLGCRMEDLLEYAMNEAD